MKQWGQLDTMALYKRLRERAPSNYRLDRVLMSGINEVEGANMEQVLREDERRERENTPKVISPRTRELIGENNRWRTDDNRCIPKEINETNLCPEVVQPRGLTVTPPVAEVNATIEALACLAVEMGDVAHSEEGYTEFDGFALAAIYLDRVIKEQYASQYPSVEHRHMLSQLYLDPLHKYMADRDYLLDPTFCHSTSRVMQLIRDYITFTTERGWPSVHLEKLAMMIQVDKQLHDIVAPWLRHRRNNQQRVVLVSTPTSASHDGWLYRKLKEAREGASDRDFFNTWVSDPSVPGTVLEHQQRSGKHTPAFLPLKDKS